MSTRASLLRSAGSALAGFLVYGAWAWFANMDHGDAMARRAGLLQGSYSFVLTFCSTLLMEWIYGRCAGAAHARLVTIGLTGAVLLTVPVTLHLLAGTANILLTILPGFFVGMAYTTAYVSALARLAGSAAAPRDA